jgi:hypothetical protein
MEKLHRSQDGAGGHHPGIDGGRMVRAPARSRELAISGPGAWRARRMAVATIFIAVAVVLTGCDTAPDIAGGDSSSTTGSTETTRAPETTTTPTTNSPTTTPTTDPPATAAETSDPASLAIDRLFEAFNAQDAEEVDDFFGDDVVYVFHDRGEKLVGADAAAFFHSYFGRETGERITEPFHAPDGRTYFLGKFTTSSGGSSTLVFDVEMDGERLVSMGDRGQEVGEFTAASQIDDLYEAFNDQDLNRLTEEFEGMTYRSPSGVEFTGADAAEHWADAFGLVVTRTSGVFAIGDGAYEFVSEYRNPDSGLSTGYVVVIERFGGQITSMTER